MVPFELILHITQYLDLVDLHNFAVVSQRIQKTIQTYWHPYVTIEDSMLDYNPFQRANSYVEKLKFLKIKKLHLSRIRTSIDLVVSFSKKVDIQHLIAFKSLSKYTVFQVSVGS